MHGDSQRSEAFEFSAESTCMILFDLVCQRRSLNAPVLETSVTYVVEVATFKSHTLKIDIPICLSHLVLVWTP